MRRKWRDIIVLFFLFIYFFPEKIRLCISCELSARQTIKIECHYLFSVKKKKKIKM